jgi:putative ABC transport system substrate-binding protein
MRPKPLTRFLSFQFGNLKSKTCPELCRRIQNLKWAGLLATLLLFGCVGMVEAQQAKKIPRIGLLSVGADPAKPVLWMPFLNQLRDLGYVEGQNITIERRFAQGKRERLQELVEDLARAKIDLVVSTGTSETQAAKKTMPTTPIVMFVVGDPIGDGLINSLAHPGGNVTGLTTLSEELSGKRVELLQETMPGITRVALLFNPRAPGSQKERQLRETKDAVRAMAMQLRVQEVSDPEELPKGFSAMTHARIQALIVTLDAMFFNQRGKIASLAGQNRLPAIYGQQEYVEDGGLMAYGPSVPDLSRRAAVYVDKILKGAKPGDLPVEQPTKFEMVINLKTAKQIGLTIPPNVLARADKVIK